MSFMSISVIVTVLNEEDTVEALLNALLQQTVLPKEVVIVDGGSDDNTWNMLEIWKKKSELPFTLLTTQKPGNRSVGRNEAIQKTTTELIAITDAGCIPDKKWLEELLKAYHQEQKKNENLKQGNLDLKKNT